MPRIGKIHPGDELPGREFKVDEVQLFLYNAALWNAHRIHFDFPYATAVEGYPGLVIAGPLMGDWLAQCVVEWLNGEGELQSIEYQNRRAAFLGEVLHTGGRVVSTNPGQGTVSLELSVMNQKDEVIIPGTAIVRFPVN